MKESLKKLKKHMTRENLNQRETAAWLGTSESQVNRWLKGKHEISNAWKIIITQKLGGQEK